MKNKKIQETLGDWAGGAGANYYGKATIKPSDTENLQTYGDLKKLINKIARKEFFGKVISKITDYSISALATIIQNQIPDAADATNAIIALTAFLKKPDNKITGTWIDKLDIDDNFEKIVDPKVKEKFIKAAYELIKQTPDTTPLESNFSMDERLIKYLASQFNGATVTTTDVKKESKTMKKTDLQKLIREEIRKIISEQVVTQQTQATNTQQQKPTQQVQQQTQQPQQQQQTQQPQQQQQTQQPKVQTDVVNIQKALDANRSLQSLLLRIDNGTELTQLMQYVFGKINPKISAVNKTALIKIINDRFK